MVTDRPRTGRRQREAPRKGDLREQAILDTAEALLEKVGVEAMTVEAIAAGAGISRGSLYFYFVSKKDVLTALVARTLDTLRRGALLPTTDATLAPRDAIARAVRGTERMWREHGRVMRTAVDYSAAIPEIGALWSSTVDDFGRGMTAILLQGGLPDGPAPTDAPALAEALCWMTERTFYRAFVQSPEQLPAAARTCTEIWHRTLPAPDL
ncbi:TetR/AcrR family transcriptional regulator [Streptomyces sp. NA02950]|uniref:TetR/AcrR family transcriptional regulator n=1 Tax=Streptomyces sp. NA02950 TaxID=2742137 RepID=UPI001590CBF1|nr:TetR/AcrR family transcriptional regulator [Streptomyces sp. NA02950]QKV90745.1 TetR/AcrR family transcriptional regulator [Streptomyces sp. NA02950]